MVMGNVSFIEFFHLKCFTARKQNLGQGNVLHLSVILLTRGVHTPPRQAPLPRRTTSWADTPQADTLLLGRHPPGRHPLGDTPPPEMVNEAGGTHPTRMYSCLKFV